MLRKLTKFVTTTVGRTCSSSSGINSVHRLPGLFVRTLRSFVPQMDARSFAYFALKYRRRTLFSLVVRPTGRFPHFLADTAPGNKRTFIRMKKYRVNILGRYPPRRFPFVPITTISFPRSFLNPRRASAGLRDAPFSARGIAIHARFNWQNEFSARALSRPPNAARPSSGARNHPFVVLSAFRTGEFKAV